MVTSCGANRRIGQDKWWSGKRVDVYVVYVATSKCCKKYLELKFGVLKKPCRQRWGLGIVISVVLLPAKVIPMDRTRPKVGNSVNLGIARELSALSRKLKSCESTARKFIGQKYPKFFNMKYTFKLSRPPFMKLRVIDRRLEGAEEWGHLSAKTFELNLHSSGESEDAFNLKGKCGQSNPKVHTAVEPLPRIPNSLNINYSVEQKVIKKSFYLDSITVCGEHYIGLHSGFSNGAKLIEKLLGELP
ncbi:predicted protein [Sclerotinia sclerotiorum 1980 UF-70]|uniref:Uncharacterized protein n=1 Tax=Sclerotinia sclerotiorum (strain ATCC 18683 / 1980 / Ss-1) TaxID=665079 RepID=A7EXK7_SCLS1|nr:predicted protein [Sclerotinia sclerotiorum 1980 UF-70]EDN94199.1 predicted protein [Sclerotinia sclerotiorum 1980 UF-70]